MDNLEEIKKRLDIVDFISKYVPLKKLGRNFKSPCPFHAEKTPSFVVSPERQIWHCFGACNEGGDIVKFLMKWDNIGFAEALHILARQAGVELSKNPASDDSWQEKQKLFGLNQMAADFYQYLFEKHRLGENAREYVEKRKINEKIAHLFYIGYAPQSWHSLTTFLNKKGYTNADILSSGLSILSPKGSYYDRFRGRLIFPLKDMRGNIIGFSGRILSSEAKEAKYINSPETILYRKREHLFGIFEAKDVIRKKNEVILMEGEFDVIHAHQQGYTNAVAIKGAALTSDHLQMLKRLTTRIVFALDMDAAGQEAVRKGIEEAEHFEFQMEVIQLEGNKDPADTFVLDPLLFKTAYKNKVSIYEFLINQAVRKEDISTIYGKQNVIDRMIPYLEHINNPIVRDYFVKMLGEKTDLPVESISKSIYRFRKGARKKPVVETITTRERSQIEQLEEYLMALLLQTEEKKPILECINTYLKKEDYHSPSTFSLIEEVKTNPNLPDKLPAELMDYYNKALLIDLPAGIVNWQREAEKTVLLLKKSSLTKQLRQSGEDENSVVAEQKRTELNGVVNRLAIV